MKHGPLQRTLVAALPVVPRPLVERFARDYVAGPSLTDAVRSVQENGAAGRTATIDVLGEAYHTPEEVRGLVDEYIAILQDERLAGYDVTLSVMMTGAGLLLDPELCRSHMVELAEAARSANRKITINMEDSRTTDATLDEYEHLRSLGHDHVGIVLQAAMRRTNADIRRLARLQPRVRMVKGIWVEPASIAYHDYDVIRTSYLQMMDRLLDCGSYIEIATHDEWLVNHALDRIDRLGLTTEQYEFQMLLGVRPDLGGLLIDSGHPVRVYVPYGRDWYEYCIRRIQESPDMANNVISEGFNRVLAPLRGSR